MRLMLTEVAWLPNDGVQVAFVKVGVLGALCDLCTPPTPDCVRRPAAALLEELLEIAQDPDLSKRLQEYYIEFLKVR